ncbi:MAG: YncE family protein [Solibacillus sp.]
MVKRVQLLFLLVISFVLTGCTEERFPAVNPQQSFVAAVNILEPSLQFFDEDGEILSEWLFDQAYTGAALVGDNRVIVYGHQLEQARLYELSSGKLLTELRVEIGTTNAYYDAASDKLFLTNSKTNALSRYAADGKFEQSVKLRNYPMAMTIAQGKLYVVNYKDTVLSVVNSETLEVLEEWPIAKSSNGLLYNEEKQQLWLGGHGEGETSNAYVTAYDLHGQQVQKIHAPLMPIAFSKQDDMIAIISHGTNMLYITDAEGHAKWSLEIAANPFAVTHFADYLIVAGYDDQSLYFIKDGDVVKTVPTQKGPFQLLVREAS